MRGARHATAAGKATSTYPHCSFCNLIADAPLQHPPKVLRMTEEIFWDVLLDLKKGVDGSLRALKHALKHALKKK